MNYNEEDAEAAAQMYDKIFEQISEEEQEDEDYTFKGKRKEEEGRESQ